MTDEHVEAWHSGRAVEDRAAAGGSYMDSDHRSKRRLIYESEYLLQFLGETARAVLEVLAVSQGDVYKRIGRTTRRLSSGPGQPTRQHP